MSSLLTFLFFVIAALRQCNVIQAYSSGLNIQCAQFPASQGHGQSSGTLTQGSSVFKIGETIYDPTLPIRLPSAAVVTLTVENSKTIGVLFHLQPAAAGGPDLSSVLTPVGDLLQIMSTCSGPQVAIVHNSKVLKPSASVSFDTTGLSGDFTLSLTTLVGFVAWYSDAIAISIVDETETPTGTPIQTTSNPTVRPSFEPTETPVATFEPTDRPIVTLEPTGTPVATLDPTGQPSFKPTENPVETIEPSDRPIVTLEPTGTPVATLDPTVQPNFEPTENSDPTAAPLPDLTFDPTSNPLPVETFDPTAVPSISPTEEQPTPTLDPTAQPILTPTSEPISVLTSSFVVYYSAPNATEPTEDEYADAFTFTLKFLTTAFLDYFNSQAQRNLMSLPFTPGNVTLIDLNGVLDSTTFNPKRPVNIGIVWGYLELIFSGDSAPIPTVQDITDQLVVFLENDPYVQDLVDFFRDANPFGLTQLVTVQVSTTEPTTSPLAVRSPRVAPARRGKPRNDFLRK
jgi:hypothetical protein